MLDVADAHQQAQHSQQEASVATPAKTERAAMRAEAANTATSGVLPEEDQLQDNQRSSNNALVEGSAADVPETPKEPQMAAVLQLYQVLYSEVISDHGLANPLTVCMCSWSIDCQ